MTFSPGTKLGTFEITGLLGKGGMGEVYRALDSKLGREVAIKVLPEDVAADEERLERFKREATTLASLDHSNIGGLYDFQTEGGYHFLVMQLIEGETLADRIAQGPMMPNEVVNIFTQIAEALEEAHGAGIVHRDLKPANIKVTADDKVRVIDFGIAKTLTTQSGFGVMTPTPGSTPDPDALTRVGTPTPAYSLTHEGMMIGTPSYMSPEQVRGRAIDRRTDIWAFGICMYEALTGVMPFEGDTVSDVLSSVLRDEVDWNKLPDNLPRNIHRLLKRCLERDLRMRLRDIGEAWVTLHGGEDNEPITQVITNEPKHVSRFTITLPEGARLSTSPAPLRFSPDGKTLLIMIVEDARRRFLLRPMDSLDLVPVQGTEGAGAPFFSPDGTWLGFVQDQEMKRMRLSDGSVRTITRVNKKVLNAIWNKDDIIYWSEVGSGVQYVPATGGEVQQLTTLSEDDREQWQIPTSFAESGQHFCLTTTFGDEAPHAEVVDAQTGERSPLLDDVNGGMILNSGHMIFTRKDVLLAVRANWNERRVAGTPIPVVKNVETDFQGNLAVFAVSANGDLVYAPNSTEMTPNSMYWIERDGTQREIQVPSNTYFAPKISPDGELLLLVAPDHKNELQSYLYDIARGVLERLTHEGSENIVPMWHPDGNRIVYASQGRMIPRMHWFNLDDGTSEPVHDTDISEWPAAFSPDGKTLVYMRSSRATNFEIWTLTQGEEAKPFIDVAARCFCPRFHPSGDYIAYSSDESDGWEIYIRPFGRTGRRIQVSVGGGVDPAWSPSGDELFYRNGDTVFAVSISIDGRLRVGQPEALFDFPFGPRVSQYAPNFDVHPDGDRFLVTENTADVRNVREFIVVKNWLEELKNLVP